MPKVKCPYREGDWFLVPVSTKEYATGVIARVSPTQRGVLLGYFFFDLISAAPPLDQLCNRTAGDANLVLVFGHLGLSTGTWPIIGRCENWQANSWPMPTFVRQDLLTGKRLEVWLDEMDPGRTIGTRQMAADDRRDLPRDSLSGHIAVQNVLAKRLGLLTLPDDIKGIH